MSALLTSTILARMVQQEVDNYAFLMNVRSLVDFDRFEIIPGHVVRRATEAEIADIRETVATLGGTRPIGGIWETRWNDAHTQTEPLPQELWRYFVVAFRGNNVGVNELTRACYISSVELDVGPTIMHQVVHGWRGGPIHNPASFFQSTDYLAHAGETAYIDLTQDDLAQISEVWQALSTHNNALVDIQSCLNQLHQLRALPTYSPMKLLGYFAIFESLLTHEPKQTDPYDSITRQIKKKIALLDNRFPRRLDYAPFRGLSAEKVWSKMYEYRSAIAHTGQARIEGKLSALQSPRHAFSLLRIATHAVARQALIEPQLLADLRDC